MKEQQFTFSYTSFNDSTDLPPEEAALLQEARAITANAYAPYSGFHVGAMAKLSNGEKVSGTNQENASYPVGICAERVLLATAATLFPGVSIDTLAISYNSESVISDHPISPCGMCRQALLEYESRTGHPIRMILSGQTGKVFIIDTVNYLLPFAFNSAELL